MPRSIRQPPALRSGAIALVVAISTALGVTHSSATTCPRPGTLGTSRELPVAVGPEGYFVGTKSYPSTLPLADREIVLTFDDGPAGKSTDAVLAALDAECVRATFFVVGDMASARPEQLRKIAGAGHTIGHHSMTHPILSKLPEEMAWLDMERGWRRVDEILTGSTGASPTTPFFRFPGFADSKGLDARLTTRRIAVFGADFWGSDWNKSTPEALLKLSLERIEARGSGIFLLHDTKEYTASMVPALLRELKARGYRVVHLVPARSPG